MICFLGVAFAALSALVPPAIAAQQDVVVIVSVTPVGPVTRGVPVEFTFDVDVTLATREDALVHLGFNTDRPNSWKMETQKVVHRGHQRVSLTARVIPVDWGDDGWFSALVNVGPSTKEQAARYTPTASVSYPIDVVP